MSPRGESTSTQAQDGQDVGSEHNKGIERDAEDGGNGIQCEDEVGELDAHQDQEERRGHAPAVDAGEETLPLEAAMEGQDLGTRCTAQVVGRILGSGPAKNILQPVNIRNPPKR